MPWHELAAVGAAACWALTGILASHDTPLLDIELVELDRANCCGAGVIAEHS